MPDSKDTKGKPSQAYLDALKRELDTMGSVPLDPESGIAEMLVDLANADIENTPQNSESTPQAKRKEEATRVPEAETKSTSKKQGPSKP